MGTWDGKEKQMAVAEWYEEYGRCTTECTNLEEYKARLVQTMGRMGVPESFIAGLVFRSDGIEEEVQRLEEFLFYATACRNVYELECEMHDYGSGWRKYFGHEFKVAVETLETE